MKLDLERFDRMAAAGLVAPQTWGNGSAHEKACTLGAAVGATAIGECVAQGWPIWLAEAVVYFADYLPRDDKWLSRQRELLVAISAVQEVDLVFNGPVFCKWRQDSILPIALESIGEGEDWRVMCREVVQRALVDGKTDPKAAEAAGAACAHSAARAALAALAAGAAGAAGAARAAGARMAAGAAREAADLRMYESLVATLRDHAKVPA